MKPTLNLYDASQTRDVSKLAPAKGGTMSADIDNIRAEFEAKFPRAVWDMQAQGYTEEMYTYALVGYRAARATPQAPTQAAADGRAEAWRHLFFSVAQILHCLPSQFLDGNAHVLAKAQKAIAALDAAPLPRQAAVQGENTNAICKKCNGRGLIGFLTSLRCQYCEGTGRVPAAPTVKASQ